MRFRAVFLYQPLDAMSGEPRWLFPVPPDLIGTDDPGKFRGHFVINVNPGTMQIVREDGIEH